VVSVSDEKGAQGVAPDQKQEGRLVTFQSAVAAVRRTCELWAMIQIVDSGSRTRAKCRSPDLSQGEGRGGETGKEREG
jgi:hypothetical protein